MGSKPIMLEELIEDLAIRLECGVRLDCPVYVYDGARYRHFKVGCADLILDGCDGSLNYAVLWMDDEAEDIDVWELIGELEGSAEPECAVFIYDRTTKTYRHFRLAYVDWTVVLLMDDEPDDCVLGEA